MAGLRGLKGLKEEEAGGRVWEVVVVVVFIGVQ